MYEYEAAEGAVRCIRGSDVHEVEVLEGAVKCRRVQ